MCASRGVGGSSLQSPGPMCVRLLVCCRRSRVEMQRGLGPPGGVQPRLVALLASTRPCAVQYSRTTKQLVGRRLWTRLTRTAPVFWLREVGFPRPNSLKRHFEPSLQALATHLTALTDSHTSLPIALAEAMAGAAEWEGLGLLSGSSIHDMITTALSIFLNSHYLSK